jgi:hypothetical protein
MRRNYSTLALAAALMAGGCAMSSNVAAAQISVSATSFNFGNDTLGTSEVMTVATVSNKTSSAAPVVLSYSGNSSFTLVSAQSCSVSVAANGSCNVVVNYTPNRLGGQNGVVAVKFPNAPGKSTSIAISGNAPSIAAGSVTTTAHPLVANYTITPPFPANVTVEFGPTTSYGYSTSAVTSPASGGPVSVLVAGMKANSTYHMRAVLNLIGGGTYYDADKTFTTGSIPAGLFPKVTATTTPGLNAQEGIELIDDAVGAYPTYVAYATDLSGNVIWYYAAPDWQNTTILYPIKPMPNGHFLMQLDPVSQSVLATQPTASTLNTLREVDLTGAKIRELTMTDLNKKLAAKGWNIHLQVFSHDVDILPNGHFLVICAVLKTFDNLAGFKGPQQVLGDVVVDLDENFNPVWLWNEFDHFDVNRHPYSFPDWTHSNGLAYSTDDGNFLISMRHQNWVAKVNYQDGNGDGSVIWKLGYQGDFKLIGGTEPQDWFYAQHNPAFFSPNTTGSFSLGLMDNGDDRIFNDGSSCVVNAGSYCYTTIPVFQVDETAKTATLTFHHILDPSLYSFFAGDVELLNNGHVEYNLAGIHAGSLIVEETMTSHPQTVLQMQTVGMDTYRGFRIPSLYPGVNWP